MFIVSSCSCLCPIHWSQVLSWELRCSWSSADSRCSNYIWVINNFIAYKGAPYIRDFTVYVFPFNRQNQLIFIMGITTLTGNTTSLSWDKLLYTVDSRYLAPVGSQNSRARVKWFSCYLALSREGHDLLIQDHRPTLPGVYNSQTILWAIIEVLTFPGSLHTSTSHQRQITTSNIRF